MVRRHNTSCQDLHHVILSSFPRPILYDDLGFVWPEHNDQTLSKEQIRLILMTQENCSDFLCLMSRWLTLMCNAANTHFVTIIAPILSRLLKQFGNEVAHFGPGYNNDDSVGTNQQFFDLISDCITFC